MNATHRITLALGAVVTAAAIATAAPAAAQTPTTLAAAGPCGFSPLLKPQLVAPLDGASNVPIAPNSIELQGFVPTSATDPVTSLEGQRVVLSDGGPYATEAGLLRVDNAVADWPGAPLLAPPASLAATGATRYLVTWAPPLRANTRYEVRIQVPSRGNCVYANVGSFTTGVGP